MSDLPQGWKEERLDVASTLNPGRSAVSLPNVTPVTFVGMTSVSEEFGGIDVSVNRPLAAVVKGYTQFVAADVLVAKITPCMENGKIAVVPEIPTPVGYGSTEFHVLRATGAARPHWLAHFLSQASFRRVARRNMSGTAGQLRVPAQWLGEQSIPIAPQPEQDRILFKLDELFSDLDSGVASLQRARANLKRYRAAVLKAAVEGHLTADWRAQHPPSETGAELLTRLLRERRLRWEEAQLAKFEASGKVPPKGWRSTYAEPSAPDLTNLPKLPASWCWASLDQLAWSLRNGLSPKPSPTGPGLPILRISAVRPLQVDFAESRYLDVPVEAVRDYFVKQGDVLFTRYNGSIDLLGVAAVVPDHSQLTLYPDKLIRVRLLAQGSFPSYIAISANIGTSRRHIEGRTRTTAGQTGISGIDVREMPVPLPPISEQDEIVRLVDQLLLAVNRTGIELDSGEARSVSLRQAILKRAFSGRLVPQDPTDEPASVLLERIRAARASAPANPRKSAKRPPSQRSKPPQTARRQPRS